MFRAACRHSHICAAAATTGGILAWSFVNPVPRSYCETARSSAAHFSGRDFRAGPSGSGDIDNGDDAGRRPFRVLIVGSGLTGSLAALRIRQRLKMQVQRLPPAANHPVVGHNNVELTVVERASYPAGRFGATASYEGRLADIGAQVLSSINPDDHRALGGHGVTVEDIKTAHDIVRALESEGVLVRVDDDKLGETEERMLWEGLWQHYSSTMGMRAVLLKLLSWANVHPHFGVRVDLVSAIGNRKIRVNGVWRNRGDDGTKATNAEESFDKIYDCVVLCIPASDVLGLGLAESLSPMSRHVLQNVGYDERTCEAHFFSKEIASKLAQVFGEKLEMMLDNENDVIQYISWQSPTLGHDPDCSGTCALAVHGRAGNLQPLDKSLDSALSKLTGLSEGEISTHRLHSKRISWDVSQMITPMEAVVADPPREPAWQCIVDEEGPSKGIIIAGDFMTQSSFVGCVATADAAARAVVERADSYKRM